MKPSLTDFDIGVEERENLLFANNIKVAPKTKCRNFLLSLVAIGSLLSSLLVGCLIGLRISIASNASPVERIGGYSTTVDYEWTKFNGSLLNPNVYRQRAGPEVDAAWDSLGVNYRTFALPEKHANEAGIRPDQIKIRQKYGGGYPAFVEGLHHLHCLDLLRRSLYFNFDYYHKLKEGAFGDPDHTLELHVTHCLDILRQQLMCTTDVAVLGQVWFDPKNPKGFPDFNTVHRCKKFETVREWARERQLPVECPEDFLEPPTGMVHSEDP